MWTRGELKDRAKQAFKRNYWKCVLVALVLAILVDGAATVTNKYSTSNAQNAVTGGGLDLSPDVLLEDGDVYSEDGDVYSEDGYMVYEEGDLSSSSGILDSAGGLIATLGISLILIIMAAAVAIGIFVCNPIEVGGCSFFLDNASDPEEQPGPGRLFFAFQSGGYMNIVLTLFLRNLYTVLWTFLFIVPGIIKSYEYRMIPYILAENPDMDRREAFQLSKDMMQGEKWNAFVLDLSFIGWQILSGITLGIVGIFWTNPYVYATNAELYLELKLRN